MSTTQDISRTAFIDAVRAPNDINGNSRLLFRLRDNRGRLIASLEGASRFGSTNNVADAVMRLTGTEPMTHDTTIQVSASEYRRLRKLMPLSSYELYEA